MTSSESTKLCRTESEKIGREFIDNWSHNISLLNTTTEEKDILSLLALLENIRTKWQKSEALAAHYKTKLGSTEKNMKILSNENLKLNDKLLSCQSQLSHVSKCKQAIEEELTEYKEQWEKLRSIVKNNDEALMSDGLLAIINSKNILKSHHAQNLSTKSQYHNEETDETDTTYNGEQSEMDVDKTSASTCDFSNVSYRRGSRKRPSSSNATPIALRPSVRFNHSAAEDNDDDVSEPEFAPIKRSRNAEKTTEISATIRVNLSSSRQSSLSMKRSLSESELIEKKEILSSLKPKAETPHFNALQNNTLQTPHAITGSWTRGQEIERRTHRVKAFNTVFEACDVCEKRFGLGANNALKCVDCNIRFHRHCQSRAPMPCIPKVPMPKTPSKQSKSSLSQYCPETHPFIPPLIIHCIIALEKDRLKSEGIYRITANEEAVKKLFKEFMCQRKIPNMGEIETENIVGCIKMFLRDLKDSLIPSTSYSSFMAAIEENNEKQFISCIFHLPPPNRDTLAYLILHLQKVATFSAINKMPIENLATVLAPTMIRCLEEEEVGTAENAYAINGNQKMILLRLLKLPTDFWNNFIENDTLLTPEPQTPATAPSTSVLLSSTPTKPSSSRRRSKIITNNSITTTTTLMESTAVEESPIKSSTNSSPLIQPLSLAYKNMKRISFKAAL